MACGATSGHPFPSSCGSIPALGEVVHKLHPPGQRVQACWPASRLLAVAGAHGSLCLLRCHVSKQCDFK
jgi:hypothetical protein